MCKHVRTPGMTCYILCVCAFVNRNVEEILKAKGETVKRLTYSEDGTVEVTSDEQTQ